MNKKILENTAVILYSLNLMNYQESNNYVILQELYNTEFILNQSISHNQESLELKNTISQNSKNILNLSFEL